MSELIGILSGLVDSTVAFLPNLVGAIILLIIGLIVGKIVGRIVKEILDRVNLDYYVTETKKPMFSVAGIFTLIIRWWIYVAFIAAAVDVLGITALKLWMIDILSFIPSVIGAAIIIVVGYLLAEYIKNHLKQTEKLWGVTIGKVIFFFIMYVAVAIALPILGIPAQLVNNILLIIIGSVGLGVAIALGLGLKDAVADISRRYVKKLKV